MIVSELIDLLRTQASEKVLGVHWVGEDEIFAWVEDLLLGAITSEQAKIVGLGNRLGIIFLSTVEDPEYLPPIGQLLEDLSECNASATVAIKSSIEDDEETVGYIVGSAESDDDKVFVLTAERAEFIQRRAN